MLFVTAQACGSAFDDTVVVGPRRRAIFVHTADSALRDDVCALAAELAAAGCSITVLTDFRAARRYIAEAAPDLVVTDVRLGPYNGLHLVVAAAARRPALTALVIADAADEPLRRDAERLGAALMTRPLSPGTLRDTVFRLLDRRTPETAGRPGPPPGAVMSG